MDFANAPKIELHCHLDGSLRPDSVLDLLRKNKLEEGLDESNIDKALKISGDCDSLVTYLEKFDLPLRVMQDKESLERLTYEVFEDAYKENVVYLELRFAPVLHTRKGLTERDAIEAVIGGMERAKKDLDIEGNIIICCMKNMSEEAAIKTIKAGYPYLNKGLVGIDLAGKEDEGFAYKFVEAIGLARDMGYRVTIHAGEAGSGQNILDAIRILGAERIGHGTNLYQSEEAYRLVKENNVHLEVCPTSNLQTKAVDLLEKHPAIYYYRDGLSISINTDNRTVSNTSLDHELEAIGPLLAIDRPAYMKIYERAVEASFADQDTKDKLIDKVRRMI